MKVIIYWKNNEANKLYQKVNKILKELDYEEFIKIEKDSSDNLKKELNITQEPALIIEEETIDFKDLIFEGIIPETNDIKTMFLSLNWNSTVSSCSTSSCSSCNVWC